MAKIRIYELARDLNMTNKALLEQIERHGFPWRNHSNTLSDDDVARVKAAIFGTKSEEIVETRVRSTIIRRRKKVIPKEAPKMAGDDAAEAEETVAPESDQAVEAEVATENADETPADAPKEAEVAADETPAEAPEAIEVASEVTPELTPEAPADTVPDAEPQPEAETAAPLPEPTKAEAQPKGVRPPERRKKKAGAAKIIKLGKGIPEPDRTLDRDLGAQPSAPLAGAPGRDAKKKKGRKHAETDADRGFFKRKISFKRKAVIEGAALYDRSIRGRKKRKGAKAKPSAPALKTQITTAKSIKRRIKIDENIVLSDLAKRMGIKVSEIIVKLMGMGVMANMNQSVDFETAALVASEFNYEVEKAAFEEETILTVQNDDPQKLKSRPPVVTIMGHVDHGKTSLLDVIRKTHVTDTEAGGITQHIGAYRVDTEKGQVVFLDTPGHEAFTAMRSRGAKVTDIVILVVAADDGVMPQTQEAINHSRAAGVPIIVAINKIDKPGAEPDRVQRELAEVGLNPEEWGGDTIFVRVSAKQNRGIDDLLEMILLQSEVLELKANPDKLATGHVIEAKLDAGRGPVATVLVTDGTLRTGDPVVCGVHYGKIRSLLDDLGNKVDSAGPAIPVEVIGLSGVPLAGDELVALGDEKDAKQVSQHRMQKQRTLELAKTNRLSLDNIFEQMQEGELKDLNLIVKADVHGSVEALRDALIKLSNDEVNIHVVHSATGTITESDVSLAAVSEAIIIGFNVRPTPKVQNMAAEENVDIRYYNVIYNVIKDVKDAIVGMMESTYEENTLGRAEVREVFQIPKVGAVAGCYVTDGKIERGGKVRVLRDGVVIYEGNIGSLRRFKDDTREVQSGFECGIGVDRYNDVKVGDVLECFYLKEVRPEVA